MQIPFELIPFSRYGNYFVVSAGKDGCLYLRDVHGGDMAPSRLYRLEGASPFTKAMAEHNGYELRITYPEVPGASACFVMGRHDDVTIQVKGMKLELVAVESRYDSVIPLGNNHWEHQFYGKNIKVVLQGEDTFTASSRWSISESKDIRFVLDGTCKTTQCTLQSCLLVPEQKAETDYDAKREEAKQALEEWQKDFGGQPQAKYSGIAAYVLWSNFVHAEGRLTHDAMYMNKLAMFNIWSWDNCFGAIALAKAMPQKAMEQLQLLFDCQHPEGALPDYVNDVFASFSCQKPPIYGWTIEKLREKSPYFKEEEITRRLYHHVSSMTEFWLNHRMQAEWGIPYYYHGNDSGWDNASVFHGGVPLCTPDLPAHLIYQMDTLALLAQELGLAQQAEGWKAKADEMFAAMVQQLYNGTQFISKQVMNEKVNPEADSLLNFMPLVIAYRMEKEMAEALVEQLVKRFEKEYGLATENPDSPYYKKGGYWLGPLWAPVTYLFIDTLNKAGYHNIASRLSGKFMKLPATGLMAENFDPFTGEGYDDNAFAWTASVYLLLREEYPQTEEN